MPARPAREPAAASGRAAARAQPATRAPERAAAADGAALGTRKPAASSTDHLTDMPCFGPGTPRRLCLETHKACARRLARGCLLSISSPDDCQGGGRRSSRTDFRLLHTPAAAAAAAAEYQGNLVLRAPCKRRCM